MSANESRSPARGVAAVVCLTCAVLAGATAAWAERLSITRLTPTDGLVSEVVTAMEADTRGFLWIGTVAGVSRFDGSLFRTYEIRDGLLVHAINAILAGRDGHVWFATNGGGVARLDRDARRLSPDGPPLTRYRFGEARRPNRVNALVEDRDGTIWAGTDGGLFHLTADRGGFVRVPVVSGVGDETLYIPTAAIGADGRLWLGTERGLIGRAPDGTITHAALADSVKQTIVRVAADAQGLIWAASERDLRVLRPAPLTAAPRHAAHAAMLSSTPCRISAEGTIALPEAAGESCAVGPAHGLPTGRVSVLSHAADGRLLIATVSGGVAELAGGRLKTLDSSHDRYNISGVAEDRRGQLWLGTRIGIFTLARNGPLTFDRDDGLQGMVRRIFGDARGRTYVVTDDGVVHAFDGRAFLAARPRYPAGVDAPTWGSWFLPDPIAGWWVPTSAGVCRYPDGGGVEALTQGRASRCFTTRDGLPGDDIAHLAFDSRGALWVGTRATSGPVVARRDPATGAFAIVTIDGLSQVSTPVEMVEDAHRALWIGFRDGGVARCDTATARCAVALDTSSVFRVLVDRAGRLWIATNTGVLRVDAPHAAPVQVTRRYTRRDGLSSDTTYSLAEDRNGRMYIGTMTGVDRLDPATGAVRHFSDQDGLTAGSVVTSYADREGRLWFGTHHTVCLFVPRDSPEPAPIAPRIAFVRAGDREWPVAEFGDAEVGGVELPAGDARLEIGFSAPDPGRPPRLQYRLRGVDDWTDAPTGARAVYPRLASGRYAFEVRALSDAGVAHADVARVQFRVPPPFWLRGPFLAIGGLLMAGLIYAGHRIRVSRLVELERIRTHIATDLHDDIGSALTRIAVLAEGARRRAAAGDASHTTTLATIAAASRDLIDTMSDIVWAVNPRHDSLRDLTHRMRRFAEETLSDSGVALTFSTSPGGDVALGANVRREIYLTCKESVTNIARHAAATEAAIEFRLDGRRLRLALSDNGRGFDPAVPGEGTGLMSLRRRAAALGGTLVVDSAPGSGTRIALELDLRTARTRSLRG